jgi:hypothetical protein
MSAPAKPDAPSPERREGSFHGRATGVLENDQLQLEFLLDAGPRIVRLGRRDTPGNILAETPAYSWATVYGEPYELIGGHRLWVAPETPAEQQVPDTKPVEVTWLPGGVELAGGTLTREQLSRSIRIQLQPGEPAVKLVHTLRNCGEDTVEAAAWSLTALAVGGVAHLPQQQGPVEAEHLPNRHLVFWPYSSIADPRLELRDDEIRLHASPADGYFKLGYFNRTGSLAYVRDGLRFEKSFAVHDGEPHADFGCNVESYVSDEFLELETLSPLRRLAPGESVEHRETWRLELLG